MGLLASVAVVCTAFGFLVGAGTVAVMVHKQRRREGWTVDAAFPEFSDTELSAPVKLERRTLRAL